jgi:Ca2+-transporting ATPase
MESGPTSPFGLTGLSESEAQIRLAAEGPNELPQPDRRTPLRIVLEVLREPMFSLLLAGGAIYLLLGDFKEALILLVFAGLSIAITVIQETRTERVLEALRNLASPRALVVRGGKPKRIAGRDVVRGDFILLSEGDRVPADARLIESNDLQADESLLTGESVPVGKRASLHLVQSISAPGGRILLTSIPVHSWSAAADLPKWLLRAQRARWVKSASYSMDSRPSRPSSRRKPANWFGSRRSGVAPSAYLS